MKRKINHEETIDLIVPEKRCSGDVKWKADDDKLRVLLFKYNQIGSSDCVALYLTPEDVHKLADSMKEAADRCVEFKKQYESLDYPNCVSDQTHDDADNLELPKTSWWMFLLAWPLYFLSAPFKFKR